MTKCELYSAFLDFAWWKYWLYGAGVFFWLFRETVWDGRGGSFSAKAFEVLALALASLAWPIWGALWIYNNRQ